MLEPSFSRGARGFIIKQLQTNLTGLVVDGDFGKKTEDVVKAFQKSRGLPVTGKADRLTFRHLDVDYPSVFELCLNLTGCFEGTGFGGINRTDIDGAGVTLGIVGFTTKHGEVQKLFRSFLAEKPDGLACFGEYRSVQLRRLIVNKNSRQSEWDAFFYQQGKVSDATIKALASLDSDVTWQYCQTKIIKETMWDTSSYNAYKLKLISTLGYALMFDVQVQNGGWRQAHQNTYELILKGSTELEKMKAISQAVADNANPRWSDDVFKRKLTIVERRGVVHGIRYDLSNYGF